MSLESFSAADKANTAAIYRLYNTIAKKYFTPDELPRADGREVMIHAHPLVVQKSIGAAYSPGIDANGMVTSVKHGPINLFVNPFFARYPRLMYITVAHEMVHVHAHWQFRKTGDIRWLTDEHGTRFHKKVADLIARGLTGIKPSQDIIRLPHSYPVAMGRNVKGGYSFIRFDSYDEITAVVMAQFANYCDTSKPLVIGEMNSSIISIFPFVDGNQLMGKVFAYGPDPIFKMDKIRAYDWPKVE